MITNLCRTFLVFLGVAETLLVSDCVVVWVSFEYFVLRHLAIATSATPRNDPLSFVDSKARPEANHHFLQASDFYSRLVCFSLLFAAV